MHGISCTYRNAVPNRRHADVRRHGSKLVGYWLRSHWSLSGIGGGQGGAESRGFGTGWGLDLVPRGPLANRIPDPIEF